MTEGFRSQAKHLKQQQKGISPNHLPEAFGHFLSTRLRRIVLAYRLEPKEALILARYLARRYVFRNTVTFLCLRGSANQQEE